MSLGAGRSACLGSAMVGRVGSGRESDAFGIGSGSGSGGALRWISGVAGGRWLGAFIFAALLVFAGFFAGRMRSARPAEPFEISIT